MAYFTITNVTSNSITVDVYNISSSMPWLYYLIYKGSQLIDESPYTTNDTYTFSGLQSNQTYTILVKNSSTEQGLYSNIYYENTSDTQVDITTDSGGGGGSWTDAYVGTNALENGESIREISNYPESNTLDYWQVTFESAGIWTITANNSNIYYAYLTTDLSYNNQTGEPNSGIVGSYTSFGSINFTVNVSSNSTYYFWLRTSNGDQGSETFDITFDYSSGPTPTTPTYYVDVYNNNQITFTVYNRGNYYLRFYVKQQSTNILVYDSNDDYGLISNSTFTTPSSANLNYNTWYIVNVGYYDGPSATYDHQELIGQQTIQTGSPQQSFLYELDSGIIVSSTEVSTSIFCDVNKGVIIPITINQSGTITLYTQTSGQSTVDDIGYLTTSSNIPYNSNGVVDSTSPYYITQNDDSGGREFRIVWSVTGPNTYYLFIRSYDIAITMSTVLYASLATTPSTDSYVYIYTGQGSTGWQKAIPYIYTGNGSENGWSKAEAYIYTGQGSTGWQKCGE